MKRLLILLLSLLTSSCITLSDDLKKVAVNHTIMASPEGELVSPDNFNKKLSDEEQDEYIDNLLIHLDNFIQQSNSKPIKVLIFIHGGLNQSEHNILRAGCWTEAIMLNNEHPYPNCDEENYVPNKEPSVLAPDGYFPIFINWRSFLFSSYSEHLYSTRQGEQWPLPAGIASSPFVFLGDVGRAIGRAPMVWIYEINNALASHRGTFFFKVKSPVYKHYSELKQKMYEEDKNQIHLSIGKDHGPLVTRFGNSKELTEERKYYYGQMPDGSLLEGGVMTASYLLTLPTKFLSSPAIDSYGKPAWDIMNRRTELLRHQPREYIDIKSGSRTGAIAKFLDKLIKKFPRARDGATPDIEITLVGHSMGTIISNWMIVDYGSQLNLKNIVYMAAASTISDFKRQVIPYLLSDTGQQTQFYNLTLHPRQEVRERNVF